MPAVNEDRYELLRLCPSLSDSCVLMRNQGILDVAWFVYSFSSSLGFPPIFENLGVKTLDEYVRLVDGRKNFQAKRSYQLIRENLIGLKEDIARRENE